MRARTFARWLFIDARAMWFAICAIPLSLILARVLCDLLDIENNRIDRLPYSGWILESIGLLLVLHGLKARLRAYGQPGVKARVLEWIRACPCYKKKAAPIGVGGTITLGGPRVSGTGVVKPGAKASLDEKVSFLMESYQRNLNAIHQQGERHTKEIAALGEAVRSRNTDLEIRQREDQARVVAAHIGNVSEELVGIVLIFLGVTFATVPKLLSDLPLMSWLTA